MTQLPTILFHVTPGPLKPSHAAAGFQRAFIGNTEHLFPATIAQIVQLLERGTVPTVSDIAPEFAVLGCAVPPELDLRALRGLYGRALRIGKHGFALALQSLAETAPEDRPARAAALELVRLWATEVLHKTQSEAPMTLRLTKCETYRA